MEEDEVSAGTAFFAVQLVGFAFLAIANQVALFFFWAPSRHIYLILCLVAFAIIPLLGLVVQPPLESLAYDLSLFLSGIILALCYFSPLSQRFKAASLEQLP